MADFEIDPMLFFAAAIEQEIEGLEVAEFLPSFVAGGVAEICHDNIATAQAALDRLIEEDTTWKLV